MIQPVPSEFEKHGNHYKLLKTLQGALALYELSFKGGLQGYEVHKLRTTPPRHVTRRKISGEESTTHYPSMERLAGDEDFGKYGWYYITKTNAEKKYLELEAKIIEKKKSGDEKRLRKDS